MPLLGSPLADQSFSLRSVSAAACNDAMTEFNDVCKKRLSPAKGGADHGQRAKSEGRRGCLGAGRERKMFLEAASSRAMAISAVAAALWWTEYTATCLSPWRVFIF